jgi:hypothetical protein
MKHARAFGAIAALAVLLGACSKPAVTPPPAPPRTQAHDGWPDFAAAFVESYFKADPFFAVQAGRHEFDGQMPDWSAAGIAAEVGRLRALRNEAQAFDPASLTAAERFEREYVFSVIDSRLYWLERARFPFTNPAWYIEQLDPDVYLSRNYAPLEKRLAGYVGYLRAIPQITAAIRANLSAPLAPTFVERGVDGFGGFADFYRKDGLKQFASVADPVARRDLAAATHDAAAAMDALTGWLKGRARQGAGFALGPGLFQEMLHATERVDVPLAELLAVGRADLERNTAALTQACAQFLPKAPLAQCAARMRAHKPEGGPVEAARAQLAKLHDFIVARHIVDIPGGDVPQVAEAPPYNRANFAYINVPGPYETGVAYVFNIAPPDPAWTAREREEYIPGRARLLFTSVHEVWPGHFLQFLHANRNPSKIAALWVGYAYAEGWAHYCEEMMWEESLGDDDPETHIGQITDALLRDVRFLSAIGLHTGGMSIAQSERLFRESAYQDAGNSRQQAARGAYDPEYLKYTLGKLMIRKLRTDWVTRAAAAPGGDPRALWHDFHEKFLSYGGPPIPMVRQAMVGEGGSLF